MEGRQKMKVMRMMDMLGEKGEGVLGLLMVARSLGHEERAPARGVAPLAEGLSERGKGRLAEGAGGHGWL